MKVCVLLSSPEDVPGVAPQPGSFTDQHTFEAKFIDGLSDAKKQIDAIVAEGYDFYFNLIRGTPEDPVSGLKASQYFESLGLPCSGIRSGSISTSKNGLCEKTRSHGSPSAPGSSQVMTCTVVELGEGCLALPPVLHKTKTEPSTKPSPQLLRKEDNPALFERIQQAAIESFVASGYRGGSMGCKVHVTVQPDDNDGDGAVSVLEVDPQPANFRLGSPEPDIDTALPGGYRALVDVFIANQLLRSDASLKDTMDKLSDQYSGAAASYDDVVATSGVPAMMKLCVDRFDFTGVTFDLACGTGIFARVLKEEGSSERTGKKNRWDQCRVLGFDIAPGMVAMCRDYGVYESVHADSMQENLINFRRYADRVDHIVCFTAIQLLDPKFLSFFLLQAFALVNKSITIGVNEMPETYNKFLADSGYAHLRSTNHVQAVDDFGVPAGWSLVSRTREYAYKTPQTGDEVYAWLYRFERIDASTKGDLMFSKQEGEGAVGQ